MRFIKFGRYCHAYPKSHRFSGTNIKILQEFGHFRFILRSTICDESHGAYKCHSQVGLYIVNLKVFNDNILIYPNKSQLLKPDNKKRWNPEHFIHALSNSRKSIHRSSSFIHIKSFRFNSFHHQIKLNCSEIINSHYGQHHILICHSSYKLRN